MDKSLVARSLWTLVVFLHVYIYIQSAIKNNDNTQFCTPCHSDAEFADNFTM